MKTIVLALALACMPAHLGMPATSDAAVLLEQGPVTSTAITPRALVMRRASRSGYSGRERRCLAEIIRRESRWNPRADNPTSSAYGLFQQLHLAPGTPIETQIRLGLKYIAHRYGSACAALAFHNRHHHY